MKKMNIAIFIGIAKILLSVISFTSFTRRFPFLKDAPTAQKKAATADITVIEIKRAIKKGTNILAIHMKNSFQYPNPALNCVVK
jgi:fucose 4-O-acetylase-like acetyltransferase